MQWGSFSLQLLENFQTFKSRPTFAQVQTKALTSKPELVYPKMYFIFSIYSGVRLEMDPNDNMALALTKVVLALKDYN